MEDKIGKVTSLLDEAAEVLRNTGSRRGVGDSRMRGGGGGGAGVGRGDFSRSPPRARGTMRNTARTFGSGSSAPSSSGWDGDMSASSSSDDNRSCMGWSHVWQCRSG